MKCGHVACLCFPSLSNFRPDRSSCTRASKIGLDNPRYLVPTMTFPSVIYWRNAASGSFYSICQSAASISTAYMCLPPGVSYLGFGRRGYSKRFSIYPLRGPRLYILCIKDQPPLASRHLNTSNPPRLCSELTSLSLSRAPVVAHRHLPSSFLDQILRAAMARTGIPLPMK